MRTPRGHRRRDVHQPSFCVAVDASGYVTTYNGTSWSTPADVDSTRALDAVSCTSTSFCVAVDTSGYETTYNGSTWSSPSDIDCSRSINAVNCTATTSVWLVGASGYATTYNGTSWSTASDMDSTRAPTPGVYLLDVLRGGRHNWATCQLQRGVGHGH